MSDKSSEIEIRPMTVKDLPRVLAIEKRVFSDPWPKEAFLDAQYHPDHHFVVAQQDNEIMGYAAYYFDVGEARLTNIAVAPEYQRKSIAKKLLNYILDIVKKEKCEYIFLDVRPTNVAAIDLYKKYGFEKAYIRPGYYDNPPEDAFVMMRRLDD
jgi:[ribosomal protein S18]-alanine N-acetyltransferase